MEKIFSKVVPEKLLHIVTRKSEVMDGRQNIISENNFIQCSFLKLEEGTTFKPHKHIWKERTQSIIA